MQVRKRGLCFRTSYWGGLALMKIMYVTSECAPFVKTGGLGDVAGSLPKALAAKGHDVRVFCPLYSAIGQEWREKFYYLKNAYVRLGWRNQYCGIFRYESDGVTFYFIDNEYYFARGQVYGEYDDAERFAYYSKAVLEVLPDLDWKPDVINCNDWQTALVPVYYNLMFSSRPFYENIKTVFTIHNIQYQGRYGREILEYVLGIDDAHFRSGVMAMDGDVNLMKAAIVASTAVTTVSPTYAQEIQTEYYGYRLDSVLRMNSYKLHGILNGIDMDAFNPQTDPKIFKNYGPKTPEDKKVNKLELLKLCGIEGDENTPVIGMVTRFVDQKGLDLIEAVLHDILSDDLRLIVLGKGDWRYEQMFLAQMIALRYGTIPIVRETGGLKDTVQAFVDYAGTGNGFTFASYNAHDMLHVIREACGVFRFNKPAWKKLMVQGMQSDFSWGSSADKYIEVYHSALGW